MRALIGPADSEGEESFDLTICTPEWFARERMQGEAVRSGIHTLFVTTYDYRAIRNFIEKAIHRVEGKTWREIADQLSWLGHWEFEDFRT